MNSPRVQELFDRVYDLASDERAAMLRAECGADEQLRGEVESLLSAHDHAGDFMARPTEDCQPIPQQEVAVGEGPGDTIDRYRLLQKIGEGGFGIVFMAQQTEPIRRKVALKIIKLGMDTRQVIARFEAERQALAMMDHPNIAQVLDAGATEQGRPYFVMELVRGDPITDYCNREKLSARKRLELFLQVCHAIQHAHQKGIIHRDLKPSNVLVTIADSRPLAKVIDFGIAKATTTQLTEKTLFTEFRQFIGTAEYMSPEQADRSAMDIDTRSDIYALGVLLYEILTGSTPFDAQRLRSAAWAELQRIIREEDPPMPSTRISDLGEDLAGVARQRDVEPGRLGAVLKGELDWIVMRALEKDRTRRYPTANAFAEDIERYLRNEPVEAGPPGFTYQLWKFARRYRAALAVTALTIGVLLAGLAGTTGGLMWALQERDRAVSAEKMAATQAQRAKRFVAIASSPLLQTQDIFRFKHEWEEEIRKLQQKRPQDNRERLEEECRFATWLGFTSVANNLPDQMTEASRLLTDLYPRAQKRLAAHDPIFVSLTLARLQIIFYSFAQAQTTSEGFEMEAVDAKTAVQMLPLYRNLLKGLEVYWGADDGRFQKIILEHAWMQLLAGETAAAVKTLQEYIVWRDSNEIETSGYLRSVHLLCLRLVKDQLAKHAKEYPDFYAKFKALVPAKPKEKDAKDGKDTRDNTPVT